MKTRSRLFSTQYTTEELDLFIKASFIRQDASQIPSFFHNLIKDPNPAVIDEARKLLDSIIEIIDNYENKHTEDRTMDSNMGCD